MQSYHLVVNNNKDCGYNRIAVVCSLVDYVMSVDASSVMGGVGGANLPKQIRVLSLYRPWPWAIFNLYDRGGIWYNCLNQHWPCQLNPGDYLVINAETTWDEAGANTIQQIAKVKLPLDGNRYQYAEYPKGFVGVVTYLGQVQTSRRHNPWFQGPWGWLIGNPVPIQPKELQRPGKKGLQHLYYDQAKYLESELIRLQAELKTTIADH